MGPAAPGLNRLFDRLVHREMHLRGHTFRSFHVCGLTGFALGCGLAVVLANRVGLSLWILGGITLASIATFLLLAMATKILTGCELLIYYHHEIAIFAISAAILYATHLLVLAYLDLTAIGVGAVLAGGRVGCLMAGCCHGRPHAWGVRYSELYLQDGFCEAYTGVRLFPIQIVEAVGAATLVAVCFLLVLAGRPSGSAFLLYVAAYAVMRFVLEFFRGDDARHFWLEFSEAQWTSCLLASAALCSLTLWAAMLPLTLFAAGLLIRRFGEQRKLFRPAHFMELAAALEYFRKSPNSLTVVGTSLGIRLSGGVVEKPGAILRSYSISRTGKALSERNARALCTASALIDAAQGPIQHWIKGLRGVYHLVIERPQ
jgi:prolipoprotein diacylglyceryltransferase